MGFDFLNVSILSQKYRVTKVLVLLRVANFFDEKVEIKGFIWFF
jgi:hypothetical protein